MNLLYHHLGLGHRQSSTVIYSFYCSAAYFALSCQELQVLASLNYSLLAPNHLLDTIFRFMGSKEVHSFYFFRCYSQIHYLSSIPRTSDPWHILEFLWCLQLEDIMALWSLISFEFSVQDHSKISNCFDFVSLILISKYHQTFLHLSCRVLEF